MDDSQASDSDQSKLLNRRTIFTGIGATFAVGVAGVGGSAWKGLFTEQDLVYGFSGPSGSAPTGLPTTPECLDGGDITAATGEGPFYSPNTPARNVLRDTDKGLAMTLAGRVLDQQCNPIQGAVLDFWQVAPTGNYDNGGFRYRGHQFTNADGVWWLRTTQPIPYTLQGISRTAHLHVKVQGPDSSLLTTQLFFGDWDKENAVDSLYSPALKVAYRGNKDGERLATFNFVLKGGTA